MRVDIFKVTASQKIQNYQPIRPEIERLGLCCQNQHFSVGTRCMSCGREKSNSSCTIKSNNWLNSSCHHSHSDLKNSAALTMV